MLLSLSILYGALLSLGAAADRNWPYHTFETGPWQPPKLSLNKTGDVNPGSFFISVRNPSAEGSAPTIYDDNGDLVYAGPEETTMDFKMQTLYGQDVITFWSGETHVAAGYGYGKVHILDNTYKEIHTVTLQDHFTTPDGKQRDSYIDLHEHIITPRNTMIVTAINITQADLTPVGGKPGQWAIASHFYEIDIATNKVVFAWNALDHQDGIPISKSRQTLKGTGTTQDTPYDIFHMNSVTPTDHGYLVSIRYMWSAFYLNKDGTVRWQLAVSIFISAFILPTLINIRTGNRRRRWRLQRRRRPILLAARHASPQRD